MRSFASLTIALISLAYPLSAQAIVAVQAEGAAASSTETKQQALRLVMQQYSPEKITEQVSEVLDTTLPQSFRNDPQFVELERAYPGLTNVIVASIKPVVLRAYADKLPLLWEQLAELYAINLTSAEIDQIGAFSTSPVGVRYAKALQQNRDLLPAVDAARNASGVDASVSEATKKSLIATIRKASSDISAADRLVIFRFENSLAGAKLTKMMPKMQEITLNWDFYFTEEQKARFVDVRTTAVRDFIAKSDAAEALRIQDAPKD